MKGYSKRSKVASETEPDKKLPEFGNGGGCPNEFICLGVWWLW
jgi:hypothetical protein